MQLIMKKETVAIVSALLGAIVGSITRGIFSGKEKGSKEIKFKKYYLMLNQWLFIKNMGGTLSEYFINNKYSVIALYGMGEVGERFLEEIKDTNILVKYAIDRNATSIVEGIPTYTINDNLEAVDVIVVTSVFDYDTIVNELKNKVNCKIISLYDIVFAL